MAATAPTTICTHRFHFTHTASGVRYGVLAPGEQAEHTSPCNLFNSDSTTDAVGRSQSAPTTRPVL